MALRDTLGLLRPGGERRGEEASCHRREKCSPVHRPPAAFL